VGRYRQTLVEQAAPQCASGHVQVLRQGGDGSHSVAQLDGPPDDVPRDGIQRYAPPLQVFGYTGRERCRGTSNHAGDLTGTRHPVIGDDRLGAGLLDHPQDPQDGQFVVPARQDDDERDARETLCRDPVPVAPSFTAEIPQHGPAALLRQHGISAIDGLQMTIRRPKQEYGFAAAVGDLHR